VGELELVSERVAYVYNPLVYAAANHEEYIRRYAGKTGVTLLLGMNPGPFGMVQTGVPFGAVPWVKDWMGIRGQVQTPAAQHPKRPVVGLECERTEISGDRFWGWAADRFGRPRAFFSEFFVWNYCPLAFVIDSGANYVPERLLKADRLELYAICDQALGEVIDALEPRAVVGIGKFAATRAAEVVEAGERDCATGMMMHPSPANPDANRPPGWVSHAEAQLSEMGLL
jgi:single-strand selective monofunctional uracil DNA glycosylase